MFEVIPAIDLLGGKCVRLTQGRYNASKIYSDDPIVMARKWLELGAKRLHIVDLDGAKTGTPANIDILKQIIKEFDLPIQAGGGIRNYDQIKELIEYGLDRVILGTTAIKNANLLGQVCQEFGEHIAVSIDAKSGKVAAAGWTEVTKKDILTLAKEAIELGVKRFIYTDISRDGMLQGPNFEGIKAFASEVSIPVIAAGGISSQEDIIKLKETGAAGCIVGKALYEGKVKLEEVL
ncbi:1-(5-phosphoribosyl)-5-[(5-phosphoribosylamino)methylideneamino]imidazole-4-carboxamide isomerase [candidate division WOR-1 bacterium RIFOXYB2_FULL_42_35]|uniref:1-(5-phosphoribosyl)-5-[(5-phosphoribosylamino)methylideneamino] imidazole-4-carboxamide isomerase n=1 Tax=candidate division WOR-1 bacterium RIFOXYC2_FULL_41_25 TaxID=1802586 RepID=A0A1F4TIX7_UNCSA|nr:MAG: 1-(5-phosphoribosyl)-5-[(5-phosphoribosylamino)methylideneamino]imidazole-4-carboxamide isomerase [candidate division WOR-1 bacterium RIFOXYA2_FULL_41_14]OGC24057.1 MAG: 1-(5-phosphoribosyl)-5-[(5-phosphoribosylamino)methylideneamino]imidazole-4-carboxamide isomerase [candidate division WOR-1 bacterium RIFOXYB2_FULL_42_35]OGC32480.1 MAG: 1-(5-phosphoribosyl)-5-[(5-phosphoribosylamino)methylideneamino]imidazole-4-carboxamide isomerase [candidate division WOR-1 bacterium RIFOXYC2_FULL_41_25